MCVFSHLEIVCFVSRIASCVQQLSTTNTTKQNQNHIIGIVCPTTYSYTFTASILDCNPKVQFSVCVGMREVVFRFIYSLMVLSRLGEREDELLHQGGI